MADISWLLSSRLWLAFLAFLGFVFIYSQRLGMSVAIVCMVNHTYLTQQTQIDELFVNNSLTGSDAEVQPKYDCSVDERHTNNTQLDGSFTWTKQMQGHLLGAFFYGYMVSQVPAGLLAQRFGAKWVYCAFYLLTTISTLLTPIAAQTHYGFALAVRVLAGIGTGSAFPTMHTLWGHWAPPFERSKLAGITYAGSMVANVITLPIAGVLCEHGFAGGWPSIFYVFGILSCVWLLLWAILVSDTPANCRSISNKEKLYIHESLIGQQASHSDFKTPWFSIATSLPVWAIIVGNFTFDWGVYTLLTNTPTYMHEVLKYDIQVNGFLSALPYIGNWIGINVFSVFADKMMSSGILSTGATRKLLQAFGQIGSAGFIIGVSFIDCTNAYVAVILLTFAMTLLGSCYSGFLVNHMDIAPQYAGTLIGVTNCVAATSGFIAPYVAALLTQNQTQQEWQRVFFLTAAIYVFGAIFYAVFASGEIQKWAQTEIDTSMKIECDSINAPEREKMVKDSSLKDMDKNV